MNTKHTPGPWKVKHSETKDSFNVIGTIPGRLYKVCRCPYLRQEWDKKEAEANAKLIAAAPELLEALQELVKLYPHFFPELANENIIKAKAAIQKATE